MKVVTNEEFETYLNNPEVIKMAHKAINKYRYFLEKDEIDSIINIAIWNSIRFFNKKKCKFLTYVYLRVSWECKTLLRKNKNKHFPVEDLSNVPVTVESPKTEEILLDLCDSEADMIDMLYTQNMSRKEIAEKLNISIGAVKRKINNIYRKIRNRETLS